jgi:hypothetical protein
MTSIKKPLIAIAAAVALATTALVAAPANAAVATGLTVDGASVTSTLAAPVLLPVPADNSVDAGDALKIALTGLDANTVVAATATNASLVAKVSTVSGDVRANAGAATLSVNTGTGSTADIYVFTTTTTAGTVAVTVGGNTTTYYVKGTAGPAYNLAVVAPTTANLSGTAIIKATVADVFGNAVTNATITTSVVRGTAGAFSYDSTDKVYKSTFTAPATAGESVVGATITATAVTGLAKPVTEVISKIAVSDTAADLKTAQDAIATANGSLAAEKAGRAADKIAADAALAAVKAKYNALAAKWNKAHPKKKVALLK